MTASNFLISDPCKPPPSRNSFRFKWLSPIISYKNSLLCTPFKPCLYVRENDCSDRAPNRGFMDSRTFNGSLSESSNQSRESCSAIIGNSNEHSSFEMTSNFRARDSSLSCDLYSYATVSSIPARLINETLVISGGMKNLHRFPQPYKSKDLHGI